MKVIIVVHNIKAFYTNEWQKLLNAAQIIETR